MSLEGYAFTAIRDCLEFSFESDGPNGVIPKRILFTPRNAYGFTYFNLTLADVDEEAGKLNDLSVSNNNDRQKILATVATAVLQFIDRFPDMAVYATGGTTSRARLYQMSIAAHWIEMEEVLDLFGFTSGHWEKFRKNVSYEAFVAVRKKA